MINKVILLGRLGKDPVIRKLESGRVVANISLATSESYIKDGQRMESTEWHNLEMWDQQALNAEKFFRKGNILYVEGKIRTDKYIDNEGIERQSRKIRVISYQLMDNFLTARSNSEEKPDWENSNQNNDSRSADEIRTGDVE